MPICTLKGLLVSVPPVFHFHCKRWDTKFLYKNISSDFGTKFPICVTILGSTKRDFIPSLLN